MGTIYTTTPEDVSTEWKSFFDDNVQWIMEIYNGSAWVPSSILIVNKTEIADGYKYSLTFTPDVTGEHRLTFRINNIEDNGDEPERKYLKKSDRDFYFDWADTINLAYIKTSNIVVGDYAWTITANIRPIMIGKSITIDPVTVGTSSTTNGNLSPRQRKLFRYSGYFFNFWATGGNWVYSSSTDGTSWSGPTTVSLASSSNGWDVNLFYDVANNKVHYCRYSSDYNLYYRRGTPQTNGTITWFGSGEAAVHTGTITNRYDNPCICVDSGGHAWIIAKHNSSGSYYPEVFRNNNTDGTWSTTSGFPYRLDSNSSSVWRYVIVPLTNEMVYMIYSDAPTISGILYNAGWGSVETDVCDYATSSDPDGIAAVAIDDDVHFTYLRVTTNQVRYNQRVYGVGWYASDELIQNSVTTYSSPVISKNTDTDDIYIFWTSAPTTNHIYYKKITSAGIIDTDPTDWVNDSTDTLTRNDKLIAYYQDYDGYIGVQWSAKSSSWLIKFEYITLGGGGGDPAYEASKYIRLGFP